MKVAQFELAQPRMEEPSLRSDLGLAAAGKPQKPSREAWGGGDAHSELPSATVPAGILTLLLQGLVASLQEWHL